MALTHFEIVDCAEPFDCYRINQYGVVYNLMKMRSVESSTDPKSKYTRVSLVRSDNGVRQSVYLHRLQIASRNPGGWAALEGKDVHHKDHNPENNHVSNLELVTHAENLRMRRSWVWSPEKKGPRTS